MNALRDWLRRNWNWKAFVTLLFLPVIGNVFAGELRDLVYTGFGWKEPAGYLMWTTLVSGGLLLASVFVAVAFGRELFRPRDVAIGARKTAAPHPHVVVFLSALDPRGTFVEGVPDGLALTTDLSADLEEMVRRKPAIRWPREMPLRGLYHHREALTSVTLICSKESLPQAGWFVALLGRYAAAFPRLTSDACRLLLHSGVRVPVSAAPPADASWDFEDYQQLFDGLNRMMGRFARAGVREPDVMLDVTGGQKTNTVVGAILTVNRRSKFQYVQTNPPHAVIAYDLVADTAG